MKKIVKELILNIAINGLILYFLSSKIPEAGFQVIASQYNTIITFAILGAIFRILNSLVKNLIKIATLPIKILTLGISSILVNISIFYIFASILNQNDFGIRIEIGSVIHILILSTLISIIYFFTKKII